MRRATSIARIAIITTCVALSALVQIADVGEPQVLDAKTPQAVVKLEGEDLRVDARCVLYHPPLSPAPAD
jgi:hypothetical protein